VWFRWEAPLPVSAILIMKTRSVCLAYVCRRMGFGLRPIGLGHSSHDSHHTPTPSFYTEPSLQTHSKILKSSQIRQDLESPFLLISFCSPHSGERLKPYQVELCLAARRAVLRKPQQNCRAIAIN